MIVTETENSHYFNCEYCEDLIICIYVDDIIHVKINPRTTLPNKITPSTMLPNKISPRTTLPNNFSNG